MAIPLEDLISGKRSLDLCNQKTCTGSHICKLEAGHDEPHYGPPVGRAGYRFRWPRTNFDTCAPPKCWGNPMECDVPQAEVKKGRKFNFEA